jgi:hypothetical protein
MNRILYSRLNDGFASGPKAVEVLPDGTYMVGRQAYPTARQLLIDLTGHPEGRHWTFDRYFRQGKYAPLHENSGNLILDLFGDTLSGLTVAPASGPPIRQGLTYPALLTVHRPQGIDLVHRADEVRKLLFAGFGRRIYAYGYDPEDVLQEVYKGLLIRNRGKCPWDATKSSFGHYVYMVCNCILSNYHRHQYRIKSVEQIGLTTVSEGGPRVVDAADACATRVECAVYQDLSELVDKEFVTYLMGKVPVNDTLAVQILPYALEGYGRSVIASALDVPLVHVARAMKVIRDAMSEWAMMPFMG